LYGRFHETCFIEKNVSVIFLDSFIVSFKSLSKVIIMRKRKQLHDDVRGNLHDEAACKGFEEIFSCTFSLEGNSYAISLRDILLFGLKLCFSILSLYSFFFLVLFLLKEKVPKSSSEDSQAYFIVIISLRWEKIYCSIVSFLRCSVTREILAFSLEP